VKNEECRHLLGRLADYVDGEASQALCQEIERHVSGCENCRVVVDTLRKTVTLYHTRGREPLPGDVEARLYRVLDLKDR
jgi:anti-sigma factor RsiW